MLFWGVLHSGKFAIKLNVVVYRFEVIICEGLDVLSFPRPPNIRQNTRRTRRAVWREPADLPFCWAEKRESRKMLDAR